MVMLVVMVLIGAETIMVSKYYMYCWLDLVPLRWCKGSAGATEWPLVTNSCASAASGWYWWSTQIGGSFVVPKLYQYGASVVDLQW